MNEGQARARLQRMVRDSDEPTLTADEIDDLLLGARRPDRYGVRSDTWTTWKTDTVYAAGDTVVPAVRNSHYYVVTVAGTSGTTEPVWATGAGATVTADGVTYTEAGAAPWTPTWDLNWAAAEGWRWKAGKVAGLFSFSTDRQSFNRAEMHAMCDMQSQYYRRKISSSEPVSEGVWRRRYANPEEDLLP